MLEKYDFVEERKRLYEELCSKLGEAKSLHNQQEIIKKLTEEETLACFGFAARTGDIHGLNLLLARIPDIDVELEAKTTALEKSIINYPS